VTELRLAVADPPLGLGVLAVCLRVQPAQDLYDRRRLKRARHARMIPDRSALITRPVAVRDGSLCT
jgi:hypothetical protein